MTGRDCSASPEVDKMQYEQTLRRSEEDSGEVGRETKSRGSISPCKSKSQSKPDGS
jgi:hypothetical protein